ncbi:MAG: six-cysteine ranthipeptide SCIFF [Syntrophomonadaceae bacterium]|jgi:predicted ribosomally synthesized six-cysteine peptide SCIFF
MNKHIVMLIKPSLNKAEDKTNCRECATSCQSACKTSCTVGNQVCRQQA